MSETVPAWTLFSLECRYHRNSLLGFGRTFQHRVTNPKILGRVIVEQLTEAIQHGEGLEIERGTAVFAGKPRPPEPEPEPAAQGTLL